MTGVYVRAVRLFGADSKRRSCIELRRAGEYIECAGCTMDCADRKDTVSRVHIGLARMFAKTTPWTAIGVGHGLKKEKKNRRELQRNDILWKRKWDE